MRVATTVAAALMLTAPLDVAWSCVIGGVKPLAQLPPAIDAALRHELRTLDVEPDSMETRGDGEYWTASVVDQLPDNADASLRKRELHCFYGGAWQCDSVRELRFIVWKGRDIAIGKTISVADGFAMLELIEKLVGQPAEAANVERLSDLIDASPLRQEDVDRIFDLSIDGGMLRASIRIACGGGLFFSVLSGADGKTELRNVATYRDW